ncbi:MAG TPA: hypothetical protein VEG27_07510 [Usitatibacter sp.]|nr:hypothetical protein [Usitatibacter sp.]
MIHPRVLVAAAAFAAFTSLPAGVAAGSPIDPAAEALAAKAQAILDQVDRGPAALDEAEAAIKASLAKGLNAHALVERARLEMIRGEESPQSLRAAKDSLYLAEATDAKYDRIYVLRAYVSMKMGNMGMAEISLRRAEALHTTDPWFKLNAAMYHLHTGELDKAWKMREEVAFSDTKNPAALWSALRELEDYYEAREDRANLDRIYKRLVVLWPQEAYLRGDYGRAVITQFADFDAGERAAEEALAIMDYLHAHQTVSLALYGRWAAAKRDGKDLATVRALLDKARAYDPDAAMVPTCALESPHLFFVRDALAALDAKYDPTLHNC